MANEDVTIKVGAKATEASRVLKELSKEIEGLARKNSEAAGRARESTTSFGKMASAFTVGQLAATGITRGIAALRAEINNSIEASNKYNSAMLGLSSVAAAFSENQKQARDAALSLSEDGLMSVTESANGLKNLLASGFSLPEAIQLMNGFKDSAAFNRQAALGFGEAIVGATEGIKNQNSILVDNAGITKNLSVILKEQGLSVDDLSKASYDASVRQKLYNGLLRETSIFSGDAARYSKTLAGAQSSLAQQVNLLRVSFGQGLSPAVRVIIGSMSDLANAIGKWAAPRMNDFAKTAVYLATVFVQTGSVIIRTAQGIASIFGGMASAANSIAKGDFRGAFDDVRRGVQGVGTAWNGLMDDATNNTRRMNDAVRDINKNGIGSMGDVARGAVDRTVNALDEGAKKVADAMAKEMREFQDAIDKQNREFDQSLKDMVIAHRDKTKQLQKDISEENTDFDERMRERVEEHASAMKEIEKRHAEKVSSIKKQMEDERQKVEDEIDEINRKNKEPLEQFRKAAEERMSSLQGQLDEEEAKGRAANTDKITKLQTMISKEKESLDKQLATKLGVIEEEKQKVQEESDSRIQTLQEQLDQEITDVKDTRAEKEAEYEKETIKIQQEHAKRLGSLQTELQTEMDLQKKYADDFARFKDAVAEDDITRLKREFAERRSEMERDHQQRLDDIQRRVQEERATQAAGAVQSNQDMARQIEQSFNTAQKAVTNKASTIQFAPATGVAGKSSGGGGGGSSWGGSTSTISKIGSAISGAISGVRNFFGFAEGGVVTKPTPGVFGEDGPEALIPLSKPQRANQILNDIGVGKNITINMPVTVMDSEVDIDRLVERLSYQLNRQGII